MSTYQRKTPPKTDCSIESSLNMISGKWKPAILNALLKSDLRLKDMQQGLPQASKRALTKQLREMMDDGLIEKIDFEEYPRKTAYYLTPLGKRLAPVFAELKRFGDTIMG